ncbi:predicted GTPase [Bacillus subtilis BEST7003]|nr:Predicted GTPase [Bacillus subtilis BEST7613]BAM56780.1 predicted GTPase [Bacillus subtilis BEST7003]
MLTAEIAHGILLNVADEQHEQNENKKVFSRCLQVFKNVYNKKSRVEKDSIFEKHFKNYLTSTSNDSMIVKSLDKRP